MAGFQLSINGRFWVSTEVDERPLHVCDRYQCPDTNDRRHRQCELSPIEIQVGPNHDRIGSDDREREHYCASGTSTLHGEVVRTGSQGRVGSLRTDMNAMLVTVIKRLGSQASANEMGSLLRGAKRA